MIKSSSSFDCLFCADPISPSLSSFIRSKAAAAPSHPGFCPISIDPSPSLISRSPSLCECSFRRRLLEFMDMAFNPTNWWTIVCSSGTGGTGSPNGAMRQRKCKMPGEVWRAGCAILARHPQELQGTDWRRPRARVLPKRGLFLAVRWMESERTERDCRRRSGVDRRRLASSVRVRSGTANEAINNRQ